jgi:hypothetical protein
MAGFRTNCVVTAWLVDMNRMDADSLVGMTRDGGQCIDSARFVKLVRHEADLA